MLRMKFFNMSITLLLAVLFIFVNTLPAAQQEPDWLNEPVTIRFQGESLNKVLGEISKQTGIAILYDQELAGKKVSGNYKGVEISEAINRLFTGKNKSIQVSKTEKIIIIKTFGAKKFTRTGSASVSKNINPLLRDKITLEQIRALQIEQHQKFKGEISNDTAIIEENMTRAQLRAFVQQQNAQFDESLKDDKKIIDRNKTIGQLRELVTLQNKKFKEGLSDDNEKIEGDLTRSEIRKIVQKEITNE